MATSGAGRQGEDSRDAGVPSGGVAADRPVVDATDTSPQELRAEVDELRDPERQRVEELRAEVAQTAEELSARLDVPAQLQARKELAAANLRDARDRARAVLTREAAAARVTARDHPAAAKGVLALLVLALGLKLVAARRGRDR
jgi:predicted phage gp36 major capsid-like protein